MGTIDAVRHGRVLAVRLAGSGANAMTTGMARELTAILRGLKPGGPVGAVLVTGGYGTAFCAGSNIGELTELRAAGKGPGPLLEAEAEAFELLAGLDLPTVAAVEGPAAGGGLELALCCDLIVASEAAQLSLPEVRIGVFPALGGTVRLQQRIGEGRARELLLLGDAIDGQTALAWGLVNRAVPAGQVYLEARALADRLAAGPAEAMAGIKQSLRAARAMSTEDALTLALQQALAHSDSPEVAEGLRAFAARQSPDFRRR